MKFFAAKLQLSSNIVLFSVVVMCLLLVTACGDSTPTPSAVTTTSATTATTTVAQTPSTVAATGSVAPLNSVPVPAVPNAQEAKKYAGTTITYVGNNGGLGLGTSTEAALTAQFTKDTGINVKIIPHPSASDDYYAYLQRIFQGQSDQIDVMILDVVWPGALAPYLVDLTSTLGSTTSNFVSEAVANDTVNGKLVAMPYYGDYGMLYYRTDLLQKYGFKQPPQTWDDLQIMASLIMNGEKATNPNITGFTWQGKAYEGLTCDALEWIASSGGGTIVDSTGKVTINNQAATKALERAKSWIGTISPTGVTTYQEDDSLQPFLAGNVVFTRNWPYAYALGEDPTKSKIVGKFAVAPLPHDPGQPSVGTLGGWQLGVSKFSKNQAASEEFVRYMSSPEVSKYLAIAGAYVPLVKSVLSDPDVVKAEPFLATTANVVRVTRPSTIAAGHYNEVSNYFFQGVSQILSGQSSTSSVLGNLQNQLQSVLTNK